MARYVITTTFGATDTLRANLLAAEYRAIQASANSMVDIDAAQTQFNAAQLFATRKLARKGAARHLSFEIGPLGRSTIALLAASSVGRSRLMRRQIQTASHVIGVSFGARHHTVGGAVSRNGIPTFTGTVADVEYVLLCSPIARPAFDNARNALVASISVRRLQGLANGDARSIIPVTTELGAGSFLELWEVVTSAAGEAQTVNIAAMLRMTLSSEHTLT